MKTDFIACKVSSSRPWNLMMEAPLAAGAGLAALAHPVLHVWTGSAAKLADFKSVSNFLETKCAPAE
jgi:hypothetical protein